MLSLLSNVQYCQLLIARPISSCHSIRLLENKVSAETDWAYVTWTKSTVLLGKDNTLQWIYALLKVILQWIHSLGVLFGGMPWSTWVVYLWQNVMLTRGWIWCDWSWVVYNSFYIYCYFSNFPKPLFMLTQFTSTTKLVLRLLLTLFFFQKGIVEFLSNQNYELNKSVRTKS